jgi:hypothetical protein
MSEVHGCTCYTEQITRLNVPLLQCYQIVKNGVYNPFRRSINQSLKRDGFRRARSAQVETADRGHACDVVSIDL